MEVSGISSIQKLLDPPVNFTAYNTMHQWKLCEVTVFQLMFSKSLSLDDCAGQIVFSSFFGLFGQ